MKLLSEDLIQDLKERTEKNLAEAEKFRLLSLNELTWRNKPGSWNVLECIEHLNFYGDFYLPEIEKKIKSSHKGAEKYFKSGFLGNQFAKAMLPGEKGKKMKTFKSHDPLGKTIEKGVIDHFIQQQHKMQHLLEQAKQVSLTRTKTAISISRWIKLRLGDTLRIVIYHNDRHILQANNIIKAQYAGRE